MILVVDNFDSFTYNLVQLLAAAGRTVIVRRNDAVTLEELSALGPEGVVLSPGPGRPAHAGITPRIIDRYGETLPILGICLGHQAIGCAFGAQLVHAPAPVHGKVHEISHDGKGLFERVPNPFRATRYHSLVLDPGTVRGDLEITAQTADGIVMGIRHRRHPLAGVQFHPESAMSEHGSTLVENWLRSVDAARAG